MEAAYHAEGWRELYVMLGGSIAALTGLLFVATSLNVAKIGKVPHFRIRAFSNTFALVGQFINSALVLVPQPALWLGVELAAFSLFMMFFILVRLYLAWTRAKAKLPTARMLAGTLGWSLQILSGLSLIAHFGGGLFFNVAGCLIVIWVVVWNAFSMTIARYAD